MSSPLDQDRNASLQWGQIPNQRSHNSVLQHLETFSEQGSLVTANDVPDPEGVVEYGGGYYHVYEYNHEGHD